MIAFLSTVFASPEFKLIGIPFLIFVAKVIDVSLATICLIFTARGYKKLSALVSFVEISVYLLAISTILENLSEFYYFFAYASGYAVGTWVGMWIEEKLSIGYMNVRMITRKNPERFIKRFRKEGFKPTVYRAHSSSHRVYVMHAVVRRRDLLRATNLITMFDRAAFYSVEDIREISRHKFEAGMKRVE